MTLGRREFLQRLGVALATLGISDSTLAGMGNTYQQALARSSRRLALLVGINQYPDAVWQEKAPFDKGAFLQGALMDIELQRELLIHRFGVLPTDIVTLVDSEATGQSILEAIQGHLAEQAQPGDTVVFHFSGLGSQVQLTGATTDAPLPTLVPVDGIVTDSTNAVIHDLFEETLAQVLGKLQGIRVMTVLDASGASPRSSAFQGNFRVRSRLTIPTGEWQPFRGISPQAPRETSEKLSTAWPGLLLRASKPGLPALEGTWNGFSAGMFTYALTQQIWNSFPSQRQYWIFHQAAHTMSMWAGAEASPQLQGRLSTKEKDNLLTTGGIPKPAADGFVQTIDVVNQSANLWLGGLSTALLPYCTLGLRLQPLPSLPGLAAVPRGTLTVKVLKGLRARAELLDAESITAGTPLVEIERRLPRELALLVALDPTLERIERVDATSALSGLSAMATTAPGEQQVDCLFGQLNLEQLNRATDIDDQNAEKSADARLGNAVIQSGYGLFSPDHTLIPGTAPKESEAVKKAVGRLSEALHALLAVKLLRLSANTMSSQLPLRLSLETTGPDSQLVAIEETQRSRQFARSPLAQPTRLNANSLNGGSSTNLRIRLRNLGQNDLYYLIISVVEKSRLYVYCPPTTPTTAEQITAEAFADSSQLPSGEYLSLPDQPENALMPQQLEAAELFVIASIHPFYETWKALQTPEFRQASDRLASIPESLPVAKAILDDLNRASVLTDTSKPSTQEPVLTLRSHAWATLVMTLPLIA